jgi:hypothetical protein
MLATTPAPSLGAVVDDLRAEFDQIESIFSTCVGHRTVTGFQVPYVPTEDGCLVSLWDAWNRFVRSLVLASCSGPTQGLSGTIHTPAVARTEQQAMSEVSAQASTAKLRLVAGEPKWFDSRVISSVGSILGLANTGAMIGAMSAYQVMLGPFPVDNPIESIRVCRNFVAHKGVSTMSDVAAAIGTPFGDMRTVLRAKRSGVEVFSEWKEACLAIAEAAAQ